MGCNKAIPYAFKYANSVCNNSYICNLDCDTIVDKFFITKLFYAYNDIFNKTSNHEFILTGFNAHTHDFLEINQHLNYAKKKDIGGINFFFHVSQLNIILKEWSIREDWGVSEYFYNKSGIFCLYESVVQHTGVFGVNSTKYTYDIGLNFNFNQYEEDVLEDMRTIYYNEI